MFEPQSTKSDIMFYGTQHLYFLHRFYYSFYERMLKAYEISFDFEENSKTSKFSPEERKKIGEERYVTFKWILAHMLKGTIDNEKYEDYLRSVFGTRAYLMFYIEKIIQLVRKLCNRSTSPPQI